MIRHASPPDELEKAGDHAIAKLLRGGVLVAAGLLFLALAGSHLLDMPLAHSTLPFAELLAGKGSPFSAGLFARAGEKKQALVALGVLALLAFSLLAGSA